MPFDPSLPRPFTARAVHLFAPPSGGVYGLSNAREWLYIGSSENIQAALLTHMRDTSQSQQPQDPTGFVFEACAGARRQDRQNRLLLEYSPSGNRRP